MIFDFCAGVFTSLPSNEPMRVLVRVYVIKAKVKLHFVFLLVSNFENKNTHLAFLFKNVQYDYKILIYLIRWTKGLVLLEPPPT